MKVGFELSAEGAKSKRAPEDTPTREPMRGTDFAARRKPSSDQKKVRRQMARQQRRTAATTEENPMSQHREAEILRALAASTDLAEQRRLGHELEALRAQRTAAVQADRDLDLADTVLRDTLTPVAVHERHTAATDWLRETPTSAGEYDHPMRTAATLWFNRLHAAVRADAEEFAEQARGMARREAGRYGEDAIIAGQVFLDTAARLHALAADGRTIDPGQQNGNAESTVTDYATEAEQAPWLGEDWDGDATSGATGVHPPLPGAGQATSTRTAAEYAGGSPKQGDTATCHADGQKIEFFAGEWMHLKGGPSHNDVHPGSKKDSARTAAEGQTCSVCGDKIAKDPSGEDNSTWHHDNGEKHDHEAQPGGAKESRRTTAGEVPESFKQNWDKGDGDGDGDAGEGKPWLNEDGTEKKDAARRTAGIIPLTNVGLDGENGVGTAPNGNRITFRLTDKERADLKAVLYSDLAMNFAGVDVDEADVISWGPIGGSRPSDTEPPEPMPFSSSLRTTARAVREIARDIQREWGANVNYAAKPYLDAMLHMDSIHDKFGEDEGKWVIAYFLNNAASFRGGNAKALKDELKALQKGASVTAAPRGNEFSLSDAKNEDGEWVMSPEQIRAEMNYDPAEYDEDDWYRDAARSRVANVWGQNARTAADGPDPDSQDGAAESSLPDQPEDDGQVMWPVELADGDPATGQDAANVAAVPTPGGESGYPQPKSSAVLPAQGRTADFRARVQAGLARAEAHHLAETDR